MVTMVDGMTMHVAIPFRIYVKAIFVSLLFYFIDNTIDLKNKMNKNEKKTRSWNGSIIQSTNRSKRQIIYPNRQIYI